MGDNGSYWLMVFQDALRFQGAFSSFWYYRWMVSVPDPMCPICIFENLAKNGQKSTQFGTGCFLQQFDIVNVSQNYAFQGLSQNSEVYFGHIPTNFLKTPWGTPPSFFFLSPLQQKDPHTVQYRCNFNFALILYLTTFLTSDDQNWRC